MPATLVRSRLRRAWSACLIGAIVAACISAQSAAALADGLNWASGTTVPPPANVGSQPGVVITSISCPTAGACTAVGSYTDSSGDTQGMLATESGGHWNASITAKLPPNFDVVNPEVSLNSVACASVGNCTAVGSFLDVNGLTQGLLLTETGGTWGSGKEVIHPLGALVSHNPQIDLSSVSCATATNCLVAGTYDDNIGRPQGLLETEINGTWSYTVTNGVRSYTGVQAGLPSDAATHPNVALNSISCGAVGSCVAVGSYTNTANEQQGLLLTGTVSGGVWTFAPSAASLPSGAATSPVVWLNSVSCKAAGECSAVGSYADTGQNQEGLLLTETGSAWHTGTEAVLPPDASSNQDASLTSVSCSSVGNCDAVGDYYTSTGDLQGLMMTATGGAWGSGTEPSIPADAGSEVYVTLSSVSCFATSNCAATGNYADDSFSSHPLVLSQATNGTWSAGLEPELQYPNASPDANIEALSCAPGGGCAAVADYTDQAGNQLAGAVNGTLANASELSLSLTAPPSVSETGIPLPAADLSGALSGGTAESGQLTFSVFGPQDSPPLSCAWGGAQVGSATVSGNGSYAPAQGFTPAAAGDYWWYASYGGDLANMPAASACGSMHETVVQTPAVTVSAPATDAPNTAIPQSGIAASLSQAASNAGGTLTFTVFGPQTAPPSTCSTGGTAVGSASVQGDGTLSPSGGFTPTSVGNYWWYASYSGDLSDPAAASGCGTPMAETTVKAITALSLGAAAPTATVGVPVSSPISASLNGGVAETGTVTFSVFGPRASPPTSCGSPTATVGHAAVQHDGTYTPDTAFTPSAAGTYWWYASYGGDSTNAAAASVCGASMPETVVSDQPAKTTSTTTATTTTAPPSVATARIDKVTTKGAVLNVTVGCRATSHESCAGALKATTIEAGPVSANEKNKTAGHAKTIPQRVVTIATVTFEVRGGTSRHLAIRLNRLGVALLASRGKLSALLQLHQARAIVSRTVKLSLAGALKHRR